MITIYITFTITFFIILLLHWFMPYIMPETLPFGVRVPSERSNAPVITQTRHDYQIGLIIIALLVGVAGWYCAFHVSFFFGSVGELLAGLILLGLNYYNAHQRIARVKAHENWYQGLHQVIAVDTNAHAQPIRPAWFWLLPSLLFVIAMLVIAFLRYPYLPAQVPTHFGMDGQPNQWTAKMPGVLMMPALTLILTAFMVWLTYVITQARHQLDPNNPAADLQNQRQRQKTLSTLMLIIADISSLTFLLAQLDICQILPSNSSSIATLTLASPLLSLVIVIIVSYVFFRQRPQHATTTAPRSNKAMRDDDRYWIAGMIYNNPDDPSFLVEKRFGIGWTINFGHPQGRLFTIVILAIIVLSTLLPILLK